MRDTDPFGSHTLPFSKLCARFGSMKLALLLGVFAMVLGGASASAPAGLAPGPQIWFAPYPPHFGDGGRLGARDYMALFDRHAA
jgi:hypothetical protein